MSAPHEEEEEGREEAEPTLTSSAHHRTISLFADEDEDEEDEDFGDEDGDDAGRDATLTSFTITGPMTPAALARLLGLGRQLTRVQLSYGNLTSLPLALCYELPALTSLSLWNNKLTALPPQLALLTNLTHLDLARNRLTRLPSRLVEMTELVTLIVEGNELECFPVELSGMEQKEKPLSRFLYSTNPLLSPLLVDERRLKPTTTFVPFPSLTELAARSVLSMRSSPSTSTSTSSSSTSLSSSSSSSISTSSATSSADANSSEMDSSSTLTSRSSTGDDRDGTSDEKRERTHADDDRGRQPDRHRGDGSLSVDLERYLDEYARCSICGRFVWSSYVEDLRYEILRLRYLPLVYRCCSLACVRRIDLVNRHSLPCLLPPPRSRVAQLQRESQAIGSARINTY